MNFWRWLRFAQRSGYSIIFAVAFATSIIFGQPRSATAATTIFQPADCARAAKYSESKRGRSLLVIQNGKTIFEHYANGGSVDAKWPIFSGTKSFWGIAALVAVREGLIKLDDHVADTITEWKNPAEAGRKSQITIRQLLNFTDGIEPAPHLHRESIRDRNAAAIRLSILAEPGTAFTYGPSHLQIFSELLRRKLNGRGTFSYLEQRVLGPLGLSGIEYKKDARRNPLLATGFDLSARQWARLGELVLGRGSYRGHQVVPEALLREAFVGSQANSSYGLTFWLNRRAPSAREIDIENMLALPWPRESWNNICVCRAAPPDMVVSLGSGYQRLFIIPSMNALIVRQGRDARFSDAKFLRLVLGR